MLGFPQRGVKGISEMGMWLLGMCSLSQTYRLVYPFFLELYLCLLVDWGLGVLVLRQCHFSSFLRGELCYIVGLAVLGREVVL